MKLNFFGKNFCFSFSKATEASSEKSDQSVLVVKRAKKEHQDMRAVTERRARKEV
jgi:hypothetical protein